MTPTFIDDVKDHFMNNKYSPPKLKGRELDLRLFRLTVHRLAQPFDNYAREESPHFENVVFLIDLENPDEYIGYVQATKQGFKATVLYDTPRTTLEYYLTPTEAGHVVISEYERLVMLKKNSRIEALSDDGQFQGNVRSLKEWLHRE